MSGGTHNSVLACARKPDLARGGLVSLGCIGQKVQSCGLQPSPPLALGGSGSHHCSHPGPWLPPCHTSFPLRHTGLTA